MSSKLLEVLVPTYCRPDSAIAAIDSILALHDPRVGVFCHSNRKEKELEIAAANRPLLRYGFFEKNRGAVENFKRLIQGSSGDYVIFLSDEDRVDTALLGRFLQFLSAEDYGCVLCSVVEESGNSYFSLAAFRDEELSYNDLLTFFPIDPTYVSGFCFRREMLTDDLIESAFEMDEANVYPHLMLRNAVARGAKIGLFSENIIIKGAEASFGGDSHSHLENIGPVSAGLRPRSLNPAIYGETARIQQFYYLYPRISRELSALDLVSKAFVKLYVLSAWLKIVNDAHLYLQQSVWPTERHEFLPDLKLSGSFRPKMMSLFSVVLSIPRANVRKYAVELIWVSVRIVKLLFFVRRFGSQKALAFVREKWR